MSLSLIPVKCFAILYFVSDLSVRVFDQVLGRPPLACILSQVKVLVTAEANAC